MQVRNQRRTLQYPRRAVLRQMLGQGSGPQEKDDGTAGDGTVGKYGPPFRIANQRDKSNDNKIKQLNTDIVMIRKWIKRLLAPIVREAVKQELAAIRTAEKEAAIKNALQEIRSPKRRLMTPEEMQRYIGH